MKKLLGFIGILLIYSAINAQSDINKRIYEIWDDRPAQNRGADYSIGIPGWESEVFTFEK